MGRGPQLKRGLYREADKAFYWRFPRAAPHERVFERLSSAALRVLDVGCGEGLFIAASPSCEHRTP